MSSANSSFSTFSTAKFITYSSRIIFYLGIGLLNLACVKEVTTIFPDFDQKIVLNGILVSGRPIRINVSETNGLSENPLNRIDNAIVILTRDNQVLDTLQSLGDGFYGSSIIAEAGKKYTCEVHINGKEIVYATDSVPIFNETVQIIHRFNEGVTNEGFFYPAIDLKLSNDAHHKKYYEVLLFFVIEGELRVADWYQITDTLVTREGLPIAIFTNEDVSSDSIHVILPFISNSISGNVYRSYPFIIEVRSVSPFYFEFTKSRFLYDLSRYPEVIIGTPPTINLNSNVSNGLGLFGAVSIFRSEIIDPN